MTPIQDKIQKAIELLMEVREMAAVNGAQFREEGNLSLARYYEGLESTLYPSNAFSIEGLVNELDGSPRYKDICPDSQVLRDKIIALYMPIWSKEGRGPVPLS